MNFRSLTRQTPDYGQKLNVGCWRELVSTPNSDYNLIVSDIVASTYDYIMTGSLENLLLSLRNAKLSHLKFNTCISGDEYTFSESLQVHIKLLIHFDYEKKSIQVCCKIKDETSLREKKWQIVTSAPRKCPYRFRTIYNDLKTLEDSYINLS